MPKSKIIGLIIVIALASAGATWYYTQSALAPRPLEKVTFSLDWVVYGKHAMFYPALDLGIYRKHGLSVIITRGLSSGDTIEKVDHGTVAFGFADTGLLAILRGKGVKVRDVGMIHHVAPYAVVYVKETGIRTPKDLEGKAIGTVLGSAVWELFAAFAKAEGIDLSKIKPIPMDAAAMRTALVAGKVDFVVDYISGLPGYDAIAEKEGKELGTWLFSDYGVDVYSNALIASESTIANNPDLVKRFVEATYEGIQWSLRHPHEAVDVLAKYHPELNMKVAWSEFQIGIKLFGKVAQEAKTPLQLGWMDPAKMDRTAQIVDEYFKLKPPVRGEDLYTDKFVKPLG